jgi:hypothetical protein
MQEQEQIIYMQTRIMQMFSERWNMPLKQVVSVFQKYALAEMIEENFDLYHVEGDESVYADLMAVLRKEGAISYD